jgi:hypothetical protein
MSPVLAPSGGLLRVTNSVAIGGTADMPRTLGRVDPTLFDPTRKQRVHRSNRDDFFNSGWFSDAVATSRAATACQNILASQHQRLGLEHWTRRLVSGHSAQCLSATTPMAMPRNNKKNAGIQFGSNGTTYLHPVPGVKMA